MMKLPVCVMCSMVAHMITCDGLEVCFVQLIIRLKTGTKYIRKKPHLRPNECMAQKTGIKGRRKTFDTQAKLLLFYIRWHEIRKREREREVQMKSSISEGKNLVCWIDGWMDGSKSARVQEGREKERGVKRV